MPSRNVCYYKQLLLDLKTTQNNSISFTFLNRNFRASGLEKHVREEKTIEWAPLETERDVLKQFFHKKMPQANCWALSQQKWSNLSKDIKQFPIINAVSHA